MEFTRPICQLKTTHIRHRNERLTVLLATSNKRRHSCPGHRCFEKFTSYQLAMRRRTLPKLCYLLTKLRQRRRTSLAIIRCFLDFTSPHTHLHSLRAFIIQLLRPLRSGSPPQRLG